MGFINILQSIGIVSLGAAFGASSRYLISLVLNPLVSTLAFGTLISNYLGCFIIGLLLAVFAHYPEISPQWKLLLVTGFLGSLTTFSSFSAEVFEYLNGEKWLMGLEIIGLHLIGGLCFTAIGFYLWKTIVA